MALYLGNKKVKINLDNLKFNLNLYSSIPIVNGVLLSTSNNMILKDKNGLYLTVKEDK